MTIDQQHLELKRDTRDNDLRRRHERQSSARSRLPLSRMPFSTGKEFHSVRSYQKPALVAGVLLVTLTCLLSKRSPAIRRYKLQPLYPKKQQTQSPIVCSHQVLNPPPFLKGQEWLSNAAGESSNVPSDGSLDAMTSLWYNGGVTCFDIDVVVLSDGSMISSHPRRLTAAIEKQRKGKEGEKGGEIVLEEFTLRSIRDALGLRQNARVGSSQIDDVTASPFPLFDTEVLPHFAGLVSGIPGAFSPDARSVSSPPAPWDLKGPLLNIDLKQGPYLTKDRVLKLAKQIHALGLEDYVAICATAPPPPPKNGNRKEEISPSSSSSTLDLLELFHNYNKRTASKRIPIGLVLRDLVPEDNDVDRITELVEELHPESIKALVPSFKFSDEFYQSVRDPKRSTKKDSKNELWRLPMTVWTIDSIEDRRFVSSKTTTAESYSSSDSSALSPVPMVSGMVANSPLEIM